DWPSPYAIILNIVDSQPHTSALPETRHEPVPIAIEIILSVSFGVIAASVEKIALPQANAIIGVRTPPLKTVRPPALIQPTQLRPTAPPS
ncbi:MAG: hypothetical protein KJ821_03490, partial [Actinobacteria bacterium]|nr:hypothetical protein [Actinomycetota bacterium]